LRSSNIETAAEEGGDAHGPPQRSLPTTVSSMLRLPLEEDLLILPVKDEDC
jgi:hypothetical protein